jgi:predicted nucleotidyltransferase
MLENKERVQTVTEESVDRLYVVNTIRDKLLAHTEQLSALGVLGIVAFGSAVEGTAHENSDLDIGIVIDQKVYPNLDVYAKIGDKLEEFLFQTIFNDVPLEAKRHIAKDDVNRKAIHVVIARTDNLNHMPTQLEGHIFLWKKPLSKLALFEAKLKSLFT